MPEQIKNKPPYFKLLQNLIRTRGNICRASCHPSPILAGIVKPRGAWQKSEWEILFRKEFLWHDAKPAATITKKLSKSSRQTVKLMSLIAMNAPYTVWRRPASIAAAKSSGMVWSLVTPISAVITAKKWRASGA